MNTTKTVKYLFLGISILGMSLVSGMEQDDNVVEETTEETTATPEPMASKEFSEDDLEIYSPDDADVNEEADLSRQRMSAPKVEVAR